MKYTFHYVPLFFIVLLLGCDTSDPGVVDDEITEIRMEPDTVALDAGDQAVFSLVAVTASGEEVEDHGLDVRWWSSDPSVFTVTEAGVATGKAEGGAWCMAESEGFAKARFVGRDSAWVTVLF